ncbi:winged helix-turn-helix transcriptional regulator [Novosphingobium panipatense]|jgi:DNA-binding HxlR family transcriptional regulator|uniref:winged helix-turn-helix transcriptional regulator n=1 Tax=Novosphingobium TaxID=165696 RepID=UPI000CDA126C|nr:winged helix-turn-helix transcriptional regulator [Novosphingobium sp. HII-3]
MKLRNETISGESVSSPACGSALAQDEQPVHGRWYSDACGAAFAMELVGERWSFLIARELLLGPQRFSEIRTQLPGLSAKTLAERLQTLERNGVVRRETLAPPASVKVYGLTEWGRALEPAMQALLRWSVQSPLHNPTLPLTPVSLMLSLRALLHPERIGDLRLTVAFRVSERSFVARLDEAGLCIDPAGDGDPAADLRFAAPLSLPFLMLFYGKRAPADVQSLKIEGDPALAKRFVDLFDLPARCPAG